ncbi:hypothetical protein [Ureibacillus thermosphaericus]|uniref:hypothetical protein n=1 Tax=Ureibacillus thermosphaericus TaxID=51173 RepID=UPI000BBC7D3F|nr:hypothetical protein [Ureibacillus thermosphaericus]
MLLSNLIIRINGAVDALDYGTARRYIEENFDTVYENRHLLNSNAREILLFVQQKFESVEQTLTKDELHAITVINTYASRFDISGLKIFLREKEQLLLRENTLKNLNNDAKILLSIMGMIK